jgi:hypothetical protein
MLLIIPRWHFKKPQSLIAIKYNEIHSERFKIHWILITSDVNLLKSKGGMKVISTK